MTYPGLSMWNELSKIHYFMDFWHFFCWRLWRPWMLLSTKSKWHKWNFRISWMYRHSLYGLKVHFWWPNKCLLSRISSLNTLYTIIINILWINPNLFRLVHNYIWIKFWSCIFNIKEKARIKNGTHVSSFFASLI